MAVGRYRSGRARLRPFLWLFGVCYIIYIRHGQIPKHRSPPVRQTVALVVSIYIGIKKTITIRKVAGRVGTVPTGARVRIGWRCIPYIYIYYIRRPIHRTSERGQNKPSNQSLGSEETVSHKEIRALNIKRSGVTVDMRFLKR
jgi:hypothetical protein